MTLSFFLSLGLIVSALIVSLQSGRSKSLATLISIEATAGLVLLIGYAVANHFTGEGINTAVWFHVRYGLGGAGFQDYRSVIAVAALGLVLAPLAVVGLAVWRRRRPRRVPFLIGGQLLLIGAWSVNPGAGDLIAVVRTRQPSTEDFFRHFQPASLTSISSDHRSFIFIFAESFERTYFDEQRFPKLITQLRALEKAATSFTNIHTVEGTGFTMGGMVGSLCGVPLFSPAHANSMAGMDTFMAGAVGITDLLHDQGYHLSFIGGANLDFAGKRKFLRTHHFDDVAGFEELHGRTKDRSYINNWGLYDDTMFDFAYDRALELASDRRPFGLFLLTLDTHSPDGHLSRSATSGPYGDGTNPMLNAVKASDELIARFVNRVRASPLGNSVVIVIVSDHIAMENTASDLLRKGDRRNLFLILDPQNPQGAQIDRVGSTLDIGVTVLPTLGFKGRLNLGRDLRDPTSPESEILHIQNPETLLSWRPEIIRLWDFPHLAKSLSFDPATATAQIDGRPFRAPVLVELADNGRTTLRFQFDALYDLHLAEQAAKLAPGTRYLLIAKPEDAQRLLTKPLASTQTPWVLIAGKAGGGHAAVPLAKPVSYTRPQIDELLRRSAPARSSAPVSPAE